MVWARQSPISYHPEYVALAVGCLEWPRPRVDMKLRIAPHMVIEECNYLREREKQTSFVNLVQQVTIVHLYNSQYMMLRGSKND